MIAALFSAAVYGIEAFTVNIEVSVGRGIGYQITGLPDDAIKESLSRISIALETQGFRMPRTRIVINLGPAHLKKSGTAFDLPIAVCILAASGQVNSIADLQSYLVTGELGLDGSVRPISGVLSIADHARKLKFKGVILPIINADQAALINGLSVYGIDNLQQVIGLVNKQCGIIPYSNPGGNTISRLFHSLDFSDVKEQQHCKRALEIAAAGGHNALMIGPPGSGKTMMASRVPSILPDLTFEEALETTKIYNAADAKTSLSRLMTSRPFRCPHHTISDIGLSGGGLPIMPGEISLAHNGILYLDEMPEFKRSAIEILRQPLESRKITINRSRQSLEFPAAFILLASMNPCPCGYFGFSGKRCSCTVRSIRNYRNRISAPLLERIDLHIQSAPLDPIELLNKDNTAESSAIIRARVVNARKIQHDRFAAYPNVHCNADMFPLLTEQCTPIEFRARGYLLRTINSEQISARAYHKILKIARSIADLAESENVALSHVREAFRFRGLDKPVDYSSPKNKIWRQGKK